MRATPADSPDLLEDLLAAQAACEAASTPGQQRAALWRWQAAARRIRVLALAQLPPPQGTAIARKAS
jgi:hypothetical protein